MEARDVSILRGRAARAARRAALAAIAVLAVGSAGAIAAPASAPADLGPNVVVLDPSMPTAQIQATVDVIAAQQLGNQFGPERYAILFRPGTYGSDAEPLNFQVGYGTQVAGLGASPDDVVIRGSIDVRNQCDANGCVALNNFWRSLSNLRIDVTTPNAGCSTGEFWAVSQAAPMRRVHVVGQTTLMDYCTGPSYASGGFIADSRFDGVVINGSQQQWLTRNSQVGTWTNGVWNQVFSGTVGAPATCFPAAPSCGGPYTTLPTSPVTREAPFLRTAADGSLEVFVPAVQRDGSGTTWSAGPTPGTAIPLRRFYVARPTDSARRLDAALDAGRSLLLTPGVYRLSSPLHVRRSGTVILGLGFPTLVPTAGRAAISVGDVKGVKLAGLMVDAGPVRSSVLIQIGPHGAQRSDAADPTTLSDVFIRIGGAAAGSATRSLVVNSDRVLLDDIWAWRADHGDGVGWTTNPADTGVVVNGDDVTAYGLFVEHYQRYEAIWNGQRGTVVFFQNEMPYDPPSQAAWSNGAEPGWAAFKVGRGVRSFQGFGMGSYSNFTQHADVYAARAFEVPASLAAGSLHDLLTVFLDPAAGPGGILNVVNDTGGSATLANPSIPVTVVSYP